MRVNKSRRMKWVGRVTRVGEKVNSYSVSCLYFKERNRVTGIGVNRRIILNGSSINMLGTRGGDYFGSG
jgi:hypothetical protein